jgi:uncharacterized protein
MNSRWRLIGVGVAAAVAFGYLHFARKVSALTEAEAKAREALAEAEERNTELNAQTAWVARGQEVKAEEFAELLRLRSEVSALRRQTNELSQSLARAERDLAVTTGKPMAKGTLGVTSESTKAYAPIPSASLPPREPDPPMLQAAYDQARFGQIAALKATLDEHPEYLTAAIGVRGSTLLHTAAYNGHGEAVKELLGRGAAVNQRNFVGETPLYSAVLRGTPEVVRMLMEAGADVALGDNNGTTPLHAASERNRAEIAAILQSPQTGR